MYRKKLKLILTAILVTSITIPMIRAPTRQPKIFNDPIGNLIADKDDPTLIGHAASLIAAID